MKKIYKNKISLTLVECKKYNEKLKKWVTFFSSCFLHCALAQFWG